MTYNIWYDNPDKAGNTWSDRVAGVLSTLDGLKPDLIGVQEALEHQLANLRAAGYESFGAGRNDGLESGEYAAILYHPGRFRVLDGGTFWLSEYPDSTGSVGWDAMLPRIATWVKLHDSVTNVDFLMLNTHLSHVGETARLESVKLIRKKAVELAGNLPFIVTGDFNFRKGTPPYKFMLGENGSNPLHDSRSLVEQEGTGPEYSFLGDDFKGEDGDVIDHIFLSEGFRVLKAKIVNNCSNGRCPSDHLPVMTTIEFE